MALASNPKKCICLVSERWYKNGMQVEFSAVPPDQIIYIWDKIAPLFEKLIQGQGYGSLEEMFDSLAIQKRNTLWIAWEKKNKDNILMVLSTRLVEGGVFEILGCAGKDRYLWMDYFKTIERFAKDSDCNRIQVRNGRRGWKRDLEKQGMKVTGYTFEKKI